MKNKFGRNIHKQIELNIFDRILDPIQERKRELVGDEAGSDACFYIAWKIDDQIIDETINKVRTVLKIKHTRQ